MGGTFHETAGFLKRKFGKLTEDSALEQEGKDQQLLGKVFHLVGTLRTVQGAALHKLISTRSKSQALCRKHAGKLLDGASTFVSELKDVIFK